MKHFLSYSLLFALIAGLSLAIGEILCRTYANPYDYKDRWLSKHASEVETLILGSSVNYYGIDPSLLDGNTFNLAGVSQNPEYDYRLLRHYFDHIDHAPRRVLLSVSYTTLTDPPLPGTSNVPRKLLLIGSSRRICTWTGATPTVGSVTVIVWPWFAVKYGLFAV